MLLLQDRLSTLKDLFVFACRSKSVFEKHLEYLFTKLKIPLALIMLDMFTEEGLDMQPLLLFVPFLIPFFVSFICGLVSLVVLAL